MGKGKEILEKWIELGSNRTESSLEELYNLIHPDIHIIGSTKSEIHKGLEGFKLQMEKEQIIESMKVDIDWIDEVQIYSKQSCGVACSSYESRPCGPAFRRSFFSQGSGAGTYCPADVFRHRHDNAFVTSRCDFCPQSSDRAYGKYG